MGPSFEEWRERIRTVEATEIKGILKQVRRQHVRGTLSQQEAHVLFEEGTRRLGKIICLDEHLRHKG